MRNFIVAAALMLLAAGAVTAEPQSRDQVLADALERAPEPKVLLAPDAFDLPPRHERLMTITAIAVPNQAYGKAFRIETLKQTNATWSAQAVTHLKHPVSKGDALLAVFRVRNPEAADGRDARTELVIERAGEPYDKLVTYPVNTTGDWTLHYVPFTAPKDFKAGQWNLIFRAGYGPQVFEVTDMRLLNFGKRIKRADLPRISRTYEGIEEDAPWRAEAAKRIDRIRKADLAVKVVDANGQPIRGATVDIAMQRHAFWFGSAVKFHWIADFDNQDRDIYRQKIEELFTHVVNENDLKWPCWAGQWGANGPWSKDKSLAALNWLNQRDMHIKGHCVIWPSWQHTARPLQKAKDDPAKMRRIIADHINDLIATAGPHVDEWDVVNEPFTNNDVMKILGNDAMIDWFKQTREHDPDARLYLNDYGILAAGGMTDTRHQQHFEDTLRFLIDGGTPLGGNGMQSHFGENVTPPAVLWRILDRYAEFGLPIQITEFDVNTEDEQLQANYTRDFMTAVFAHEAVNGFVMWGFYAGAHWRPEAAMFRKDWSIKPNGEQYKRLVFEKWWTDETVKTDADGSASVRGFLGDYNITITHAGKTVEKSIELQKGTSPITVPLD